MNKLLSSCIIFTLSLCSTPLFADDDDHDRTICGAVKPLLSVADFNGNGIVDQDDVKLIKSAKKKELYFALYDVDTNGKVDDEDITIVTGQLGLTSQPIDQQFAFLFNRNKQFQLVEDSREIAAMGYFEVASSLAGHGEHWDDFVDPVTANYLRPNGLNVPKAHDSVSGVFWLADATPVFEFGATDYPTPGGEWEAQRVIAFNGAPPKIFASPHEHWHTHAALCTTVEMGASGPEIILNQHMTFAQCQELPSLVKDPDTGYNHWRNIWMLHAWLFDLNPNGVFGNTHPCVDPDSPSEDMINGDREVPPFFEHH